HLELAELAHHVAPARVVETIDVEHPVQVIGLVLEDPRQQTLGRDVEWFAVELGAHQPNPPGANRRVVRTGDRQATLLERFLALRFGEPGVRDEAGVSLAIVVDEARRPQAHLVPGQTDAGSRVHRLQHVIDDPPERVVERLDRRGRRAEHGVAERSDLHHGHDVSPNRRGFIAHRCGSASTRVTIPAAASRRISAPKPATRPASSATKHIVAPPTFDESSVAGSSAASSRSSSAPPVTRNTGDPTGNPASARRGASARRNRSGRPETRAWTAGSFGASVCTMTRPSGRAQAAASNHVTSTRSRASTPGRRSEASACRMATRSTPGEPTSFNASTPPTSTSRARGARGGSSRPINDTGTVATPRAHSSTRSAPRRAIPKSVAPQEAQRPGASHTTHRMLPRSSRSMPRHDAHAAGSPQDLQTRATP